MARLLVSICVVFIASSMMGQDTLLLLNGKQLIVDITEDSGANVFFDVAKRNGKVRNIAIHKLEIFSIAKRGEEKSVLYVQDPDMGYELNLEDMRYYMSGQDDARQGYRTWPSMAGGFAFGVSTVLFLEGGYVPFTTPFIYGFAMQIPYIKIKESSIGDKRNTISDYYVEGYNKTARSKKLISNFAATMAGVIVGSVIFEVSQ